MGWMITNRGKFRIKGKISKVLFNEEEYTSSTLAVELGMTQPAVSNRIRRHVNDEITFEEMVSSRNVKTLMSKVDGKMMSAKQLAEETGYSTASVITRMHKYNKKEITVNQLRKKKNVNIFDERHLEFMKSKVQPRHVGPSDDFKTMQKFKDQEYHKALRLQKLGTV